MIILACSFPFPNRPEKTYLSTYLQPSTSSMPSPQPPPFVMIFTGLETTINGIFVWGNNTNYMNQTIEVFEDTFANIIKATLNDTQELESISVTITDNSTNPAGRRLQEGTAVVSFDFVIADECGTDDCSDGAMLAEAINESVTAAIILSINTGAFATELVAVMNSTFNATTLAAVLVGDVNLGLITPASFSP